MSTPPADGAPLNVVIATRNPGKFREFQALLAELGWCGMPPTAFGDLPLVKETGASLSENARLKALAMARATGLPALADDTGLEVDALGGLPGVRSARWAGDGADARANNRKLLEELGKHPTAPRTARFRTVIALASPGEGACPPAIRFEAEGVLEGTIAMQPRGEGGFGYDPLFVPEGEKRTLAEMSAEEKNAISHRARALAALRRALEPTAGAF